MNNTVATTLQKSTLENPSVESYLAERVDDLRNRVSSLSEDRENKITSLKRTEVQGHHAGGYHGHVVDGEYMLSDSARNNLYHLEDARKRVVKATEALSKTSNNVKLFEALQSVVEQHCNATPNLLRQREVELLVLDLLKKVSACTEGE